MSDTYNNYLWHQIFNELLQSRLKIVVSNEFHKQVEQIDILLKNDKTGIVSTIYEFMVQSATTNFMFESGNQKLDEVLKAWSNHLNQDIGQDIPTGLRPLTQQYFRERWRSSFIVLNINWEKKDGYLLPSEMWFADGASIYVDGESNRLGGYKYTIGTTKKIPLVTKDTTTILIRKPYNAWFDKYPTPYLVKKGTLYHSLIKTELVSRQSDVINSIVPYILLIRAGNDTFAKSGEMPTKEELEALKEKFKEMSDNYKYSREKGTNYGAFSYDVGVEHLIPDLTKILNDNIVSPANKNLLFSLGLVELEGFSNDRKEAILNPKVLVEEVKNAVNDWADLLEDVLFLIIEKNKASHPKTTNTLARVVPGVVKAFITNDMRVMLRSLFDRGTIGHQDILEATTDLDFEISFNRRKKEVITVDKILYPHVIQNIENEIRDVADPLKEVTPEKKKSEPDIQTAEIEDFTKLPRYQELEATEEEITKYLNEDGSQEYLQAPYTEDNYPAQIKNLPKGARTIWIKTFNKVYEETKDEDKARQSAWRNVKLQYKKVEDKWVKKAKIETIDELAKELKEILTIPEQIKLVKEE